MTTCRDVITRAYQMMGVAPIGEDIDATEAETGLSVLQSIFDRIVDKRVFKPVIASGIYDANEGERISGAASVVLPTVIEDDCEDRPPHDRAMIQYDIGAGMLTFAWDRTAWTALDGLSLNSSVPFARNSEGLSALVALELSETYPGAAVGPFTVRKAQQWQGMWTYEAPIDPEYF